MAKLHRFYAGELHDKRGPIELGQKVWIHDPLLLRQWLKVLRLRVREELVLFDGQGNDRIYRIHTIEPTSVGLELVTQQKPVLPTGHRYIFWALLKKDNNDLVLQKCTELGITNLVPLLTARTEKTGFDVDRARRIVIEAAEQCGRSDIPHIREPLELSEVVSEYAHKVQLYVADQQGSATLQLADKAVGVLIGPEGGWTDEEKALMVEHGIAQAAIATHTLRAETAAIVAAAQLLQ